MKYLIIYTAFIVLAISCSPPVVFNDPYPIDEDNLLTIPDEYQGLYMCESDSTLIHVGSTYIVSIESVKFTSHINDINQKENCAIVNDEIYLTERTECIPIKYINDTIVEGITNDIDTLWALSPQSVARNYQGNIILSTQMKNNEWSIDILSIDKYKNVMYRAINEASEIDEIEKVTPLKNITKLTDETPRYKVTPTQKEFDVLFQNNKVFPVCEYLIRVNSESLIQPIIYY